MAADPKFNDRIVAGPGGAIMYSYPPNDEWKWENKPVMLAQNDYLFATGVKSQDGLMYEVYIYRRKGSGTVYKTQAAAQGKGDVLNSIGNLITFSPDKVVKEYKWFKTSQVRVEIDSANVNNTPDTGSSTSQELTEKARLEAELDKLVYGPSPTLPKHTLLTKNSEGKWILAFQNGYTVDYSTFINLTPVERQTAVTMDLRTGMSPGGPKPPGGDEKFTFPTWAYGIIAVLVVSVLGLFVLSSKPKSKKR